MASPDDPPFGDPEPDDEPSGYTGRSRAPKNRNRLERGHQRRMLIHELAVGAKNQRVLAAERGVSYQSIWEFSKRHAEEIEQAKAALDAEFVGLWIADKRNRLAELQTMADDLLDLLAVAADTTPPERSAAAEAAFGEPDPTTPDIGQVISLVTATNKILRAAAEELGQIPNRVRMDLGGTVTTVRLEGVDLEAL